MKQIPVILTDDQIGAMLQILDSQASCQGTTSMRVIIGIEDTLIKAQKEAEDKE